MTSAKKKTRQQRSGHVMKCNATVAGMKKTMNMNSTKKSVDDGLTHVETTSQTEASKPVMPLSSHPNAEGDKHTMDLVLRKCCSQVNINFQ